MTPRVHACGRCVATWTGGRASHCTACHRTFSALTAFDRHRVRRGAVNVCADPATVGLVAHIRGGATVWALPPVDGEAPWRR